jgi:hypothetical protein
LFFTRSSKKQSCPKTVKNNTLNHDLLYEGEKPLKGLPPLVIGDKLAARITKRVEKYRAKKLLLKTRAEQIKRQIRNAIVHNKKHLKLNLTPNIMGYIYNYGIEKRAKFNQMEISKDERAIKCYKWSHGFEDHFEPDRKFDPVTNFWEEYKEYHDNSMRNNSPSKSIRFMRMFLSDKWSLDSINVHYRDIFQEKRPIYPVDTYGYEPGRYDNNKNFKLNF